MYDMTVLARYLSSSDTRAPEAGRRANKSAENPANVIIRPANVYKSVSPLNSMFLLRSWISSARSHNLTGDHGVLIEGVDSAYSMIAVGDHYPPLVGIPAKQQRRHRF